MDGMEMRIRGVVCGGWFRSNERMIYASMAARVFAMFVVAESQRREQEARHLVALLQEVERLTESRTRQALLAAMSRGVENAKKRSANRDGIATIAATAEH